MNGGKFAQVIPWDLITTHPHHYYDTTLFQLPIKLRNPQDFSASFTAIGEAYSLVEWLAVNSGIDATLPFVFRKLDVAEVVAKAVREVLALEQDGLVTSESQTPVIQSATEPANTDTADSMTTSLTALSTTPPNSPPPYSQDDFATKHASAKSLYEMDILTQRPPPEDQDSVSQEDVEELMQVAVPVTRRSGRKARAHATPDLMPELSQPPANAATRTTKKRRTTAG